MVIEMCRPEERCAVRINHVGADVLRSQLLSACSRPFSSQTNKSSSFPSGCRQTLARFIKTTNVRLEGGWDREPREGLQRWCDARASPTLSRNICSFEVIRLRFAPSQHNGPHSCRTVQPAAALLVGCEKNKRRAEGKEQPRTVLPPEESA